MGFLRMGVVTTYMSECLIGGFTTGAAVHVFSSQVKYVLGLKIKRFGGVFQLLFVSIVIFESYYKVHHQVTALYHSFYIIHFITFCSSSLIYCIVCFLYHSHYNGQTGRNLGDPGRQIQQSLATLLNWFLLETFLCVQIPVPLWCRRQFLFSPPSSKFHIFF